MTVTPNSVSFSRMCETLPAHLDKSLTKDPNLAEQSRWRIGGHALGLFRPTTEQEVAELLELLTVHSIPHVIVGSMSNILFDSRGYNGVIIQITDNLSSISQNGSTLEVQAGAQAYETSMYACEHNLTGIEHIVGIPGTIGGLTVMNGGSKRKGIGSVVSRVKVASRYGAVREIEASPSWFSYRSSIFQETGDVLLSICLKLELGDQVLIRNEIDSILDSRADRFPEDQPNCGSTFLSSPGLFRDHGAPGKLIESVGLKGYSIGGAEISPKHANFVVNRGNATSDDIIMVVTHAREKVYVRYGAQLKCEVRYLDFNGRIESLDAYLPPLNPPAGLKR